MLLFSAIFAVNLCTTSILGQSASAPIAISAAELDASKHLYKHVSVCGTVVEVFQDEIDSQWTFLIIKDDATFLPVGIGCPPEGINPSDWLDAKIRITGRYHTRTTGTRFFMGPHLIACAPLTNNVQLLSPPPVNAYSCEPLDQSQQIAPKDLAKLGRRSVSGVVSARWNRQSIAVRTKSGDTVIVKLRSNEAPPLGTRVRAVGYPETDLYRLFLSRAICREQPEAAAATWESPIRVTPKQFFLDGKGRDKLHFDDCNGKLITISGVVRYVNEELTGVHIDLFCDHHALTVNIDRAFASELTDLKPGTGIEVTGLCIMECETWNPTLAMPHITDCRLFPRTAKDVRIIFQPPWWTPKRFAVIVGILLLGIIGFAVWSAALRRIIRQRCRELLNEQIAHISADLRTDERTRLAIELHDALSQNLEGVAFQIAATKDLMGKAPGSAKQTLDAANNMLLASRTELKRCLFDLRHDALEAKSFDEALRTILDPVSGNAELFIRFNVRRDIFTDQRLTPSFASSGSLSRTPSDTARPILFALQANTTTARSVSPSGTMAWASIPPDVPGPQRVTLGWRASANASAA